MSPRSRVGQNNAFPARWGRLPNARLKSASSTLALRVGNTCRRDSVTHQRFSRTLNPSRQSGEPPCVRSSWKNSAALKSLVFKEIPDPEPKAGPCRHRSQGVRHQPRRDAHAKRGMGRGREGQRHRVCRACQILPRRRIRGRHQGGRVDGRPGAEHQRQLRRVYARARGERRADRVRSSLGRTGRDSASPTPPPGPACSATWNSSRARLWSSEAQSHRSDRQL